MEILFGVLVLVLLIWGLANRKKAKKEWIQEERYEESGSWIDKRSGERGTYGSLDEEMESNRKYISLQGKVLELSRMIQKQLTDQQPAYAGKDMGALQTHFTVIKSEIQEFLGQIQSILKGRDFSYSAQEPTELPLVTSLKKQILDYCYQEFPELLEVDIAQLKRLDESCAQLCVRILK